MKVIYSVSNYDDWRDFVDFVEANYEMELTELERLDLAREAVFLSEKDMAGSPYANGSLGARINEAMFRLIKRQIPLRFGEKSKYDGMLDGEFCGLTVSKKFMHELTDYLNDGFAYQITWIDNNTLELIRHR